MTSLGFLIAILSGVAGLVAWGLTLLSAVLFVLTALLLPPQSNRDYARQMKGVASMFVATQRYGLAAVVLSCAFAWGLYLAGWL